DVGFDCGQFCSSMDTDRVAARFLDAGRRTRLMDPIENIQITAQEIITFGRAQGVDLMPLCTDGRFQKERRWILLWRTDELTYSGRVEEKEGTLHYNMQGAISVLPGKLKGSSSAFRSASNEAGTLEDIEQAFELLRAWLLVRKEVDDLPNRSVRRYGI